MSRYPKVRSNQTEVNQSIFSSRVVSLVREGHALSEMECAPLVKKWLQSVPSEHRPTVDGVLMSSKRELWGLEAVA